MTGRANQTVLWCEDAWTEQSEGQDDDVLDLQGKWVKLAQDRVLWRSAHSSSRVVGL